MKGMTVSELFEEGGTLQMLTNLGLVESMTPTDLLHLDQSQHIAVVAGNCTEHMLRTEERLSPTEKCLINQSEVTVRMRATLISWLFEVHRKFKLQ